VATGLVSSLAQPGSNVTGLSALAPELEGKRLELFTQAVPQLSRVVALLNPANPFTTIAWQAIQPAAAALGVQLQPVEVRDPHDLDRALASTLGGIIRRIWLAALRLITNSNFVGCSTGKSAGFAPFKILST